MFTPQTQGVFERLRGEHYISPALLSAKTVMFVGTVWDWSGGGSEQAEPDEQGDGDQG